MNLINLCLRIPNLGILIFFLIFIVIIPYLLVLNSNLTVLKFYLPLLVAFANLLTKAGDPKIFENLYDLQPKNFVSFLSSNFINLFTLFGILWQCLEYSKTKSGNVTKAVIYGAVLFIIAFPFARNGLEFVVDNLDDYLKENTNLTYEYNWHMFVGGLLYIIFLLGMQAILLNLVDGTSELSRVESSLNRNRNNNNEKEITKSNTKKINKLLSNIEKNNKNNKNNKKNNNLNDNLNNNLNDDLNEVNNKNSKNNKNNKNARNLLKQATLTNLSNFAKKL